MNNATQANPIKNIVNFRIQKADGRFLNAGTGVDSWFTLEQARHEVDYNSGQRIVEFGNGEILWEIF